MLNGTLALLERSLRIDVRSITPHLIRFLLMVSIVIGVFYTQRLGIFVGAPGLIFFRSIVWLDLTALTFLGISYFSSAITEEREEGTLGLMLMAGISPIGILIGKSGARLLQTILLITVQFPFTFLAITMGGITQEQILASYLSMIAYSVMLCGLGLACSTLAPSSQVSSRWMSIILIFYFLLSFLAEVIVGSGKYSDPFWLGVLSWAADSSVLLKTSMILGSGFRDSALGRQVISNVAVGFLTFVVSWILFGISQNLEFGHAGSNESTFCRRSRRYFRIGRPYLNPFAWKDFHFAAGGRRALVLRVFYYSILAAGIYAYAGVWYSKQIQMLYRFSSIMFIMLCTCSLIIDAALLVSRSLSVEIREQNLAALMLLPDRFAYICYSKIFGAFLIWLPGPIALALVFICTVDGQSFADEIYNHQLTYAWIITAYCVIPHVAAVASLLTRWGAVPIGICIGLANLFISVSILSYLTVIQDSEVFLWIALINLGLCCVCHVSVGRQFKSLAARS